jgi:hypothetical protein
LSQRWPFSYLLLWYVYFHSPHFLMSKFSESRCTSSPVYQSFKRAESLFMFEKAGPPKTVSWTALRYPGTIQYAEVVGDVDSPTSASNRKYWLGV